MNPSTATGGRHRNKVHAGAAQALADLGDGARIMIGGFGLCGNAEALIAAVVESGARDFTIISNNAGNLGKGLATWLQAGIVRKVICTYIGNNEDLHRLMAAGKVEVEINPQGTFVERMRAAGAGIAAFYTPTGVGTVVAEGKEVREFEGRAHVLERALSADFDLIRARRGDRFGNLRFWRTARNFSPIMATAARVTIAEVDELVEVGQIDPDDVHLPGIFVHRIIEVRGHEDPFEYRTVRPRPNTGHGSGHDTGKGA
jgi:3-oxoacid CoA-transferase subunit A